MQNSKKNKKKEMVIVDTSIWIEYFNRARSSRAEKLKKLMEQEKVAIAGVIIAELLQGAKNEAELEELREALITLPLIKEEVEDWEEVGRLSFQMRKEGLLIPLTDCLIGVLARKEGYPVFTLDEHFKYLKKVKLYSS